MWMIERIEISQAMLISSSIPESDYPVWSNAETYSLGERVVSSSRIWESVQDGNYYKTPQSNSGVWWVDVGATNRWRAFDSSLAPKASAGFDIYYMLRPSELFDSVAIFGPIGGDVQITIRDLESNIIYDQTLQLAGARDATDWYPYFFAPFPPQESVVVSDLPGVTGAILAVRISGGGQRAVGEIIVGRKVIMGRTLVDTTSGFRDFSTVDRDDWGNQNIVRRGYARTVDYRISIPSDDVRRVSDAVIRNRARICVFSAGDGTDHFGTTVLGVINSDGLSIPITTNVSFATISVDGILED